MFMDEEMRKQNEHAEGWRKIGIDMTSHLRS